MKLVAEWRSFWRMWSIQLGVIGTTLTGLFTLWPDSALFFWNAMPLEVKQLIPEKYIPLIGVFIFVMSMVARLFQQRKLQEIKDAKTAE